MKRLYILLLLILIPTIIFAQYRYDGRRIWPATIDSTKFTSDRSAAIGPAVIGGVQMVDATFGELWIPVDFDSGGAISSTVYASGAWQFGADNFPTCGYSGTEPAFKTFGFDAGAGSADDSAWFNFICPANYKDDTMELYLVGFHLDNTSPITDSIVICGTVNAFTAGDLSHLWAAGTAMTPWADVITNVSYASGTTDSCLHVFNLDPEVEEIDPGDLVRILIYFDESRCDLASDFFIIGALIRWDILDVP